MREKIGHVLKAESLEKLAKRLAYALRGEAADQFGRTSLVNGVGSMPSVEEGPFCAYPAKTLMTTTYCGLTITRRRRCVASMALSLRDCLQWARSLVVSMGQRQGRLRFLRSYRSAINLKRTPVGGNLAQGKKYTPGSPSCVPIADQWVPEG
jgi:hypothetical protein